MEVVGFEEEQRSQVGTPCSYPPRWKPDLGCQLEQACFGSCIVTDQHWDPAWLKEKGDSGDPENQARKQMTGLTVDLSRFERFEMVALRLLTRYPASSGFLAVASLVALAVSSMYL